MERYGNNHKIKSKFLVANRMLKTKFTKMSQKAKELVSKTPLSILVVDDELDTIKALEKMLKKKGYGVQVAFDGLEASKKLRSNHFDLVITDYLMPKLDGLQLLKVIRRKHPMLKVVVITAVDDENIQRQFLSMDVSAYLRKPFERKQLFDIVSEIIQSSAETEAYMEDIVSCESKSLTCDTCLPPTDCAGAANGQTIVDRLANRTNSVEGKEVVTLVDV